MTGTDEITQPVPINPEEKPTFGLIGEVPTFREGDTSPVNTSKKSEPQLQETLPEWLVAFARQTESPMPGDIPSDDTQPIPVNRPDFPELGAVAVQDQDLMDESEEHISIPSAQAAPEGWVSASEQAKTSGNAGLLPSEDSPELANTAGDLSESEAASGASSPDQITLNQSAPLTLADQLDHLSELLASGAFSAAAGFIKKNLPDAEFEQKASVALRPFLKLDDEVSPLWDIYNLINSAPEESQTKSGQPLEE